MKESIAGKVFFWSSYYTKYSIVRYVSSLDKIISVTFKYSNNVSLRVIREISFRQ